MGRLILKGATFSLVVVVASCFELYSPALDLIFRTSKYKCFEEGRFHHPEQCGAYVECVRSREGTFKRRFGSCHGTMFNDQLKRCVEPDEESPCKTKSRNERSVRGSTGNQRFNELCRKIKNGFVCADCKTALNCVNGFAYAETCGVGDTCDERTAFGGAVCYPGQPQSCTCHDKYAFHVDMYNNQTFLYCDQMGAEPVINHCPDGWIFDENSDVCINKERLPECQKSGRFALHNNCTEYYTCIYSKTGWVQKPFTCENGFMLNEETGLCEDPCTWDMGEFQCNSEGRYPDPLSCQNYYECVQIGEAFRKYHRECPEGTVWYEKALGDQGHCVEDNTVDCEPVKVKKCHIPEGRCPVNPVQPPSVIPTPQTQAPLTPSLEIISPDTSSPMSLVTGDPMEELKARIKSLRETKSLLEKDIEDGTLEVNALRETSAVLSNLLSTLLEIIGQETPVITDFVRVTIDSEGSIMISSYCLPNDGTIQIRTGKPLEMLVLILSDLEMIIEENPELINCMNHVIADFTRVLRDNIELIDGLASALDPLIDTIAFASQTFNETEENLRAAHEKLQLVTLDLQALEAQLPAGTNVRSPSGQPSFWSSVYQGSPQRTAVAVHQQRIPVSNRWQIMNRGVRRCRSQPPSK